MVNFYTILTMVTYNYCLLPLEKLIQPAIKSVQQGVTVTIGFSQVLELLWPIYSRCPIILQFSLRPLLLISLINLET